MVSIAKSKDLYLTFFIGRRVSALFFNRLIKGLKKYLFPFALKHWRFSPSILIVFIQSLIFFLTGDYVWWEDDYEPALDFLSRLKANTGIWAVMGDYDYSISRKCCLFCHEKESGSLAKNIKFSFREIKWNW